MKAEGFVFVAGQQSGLGVLDGVEDAINSGFRRGFDKAACGLGDGCKPLHHGFGVLADVQEECFPACQVFRLCQRTENGLEDGNLRAEFGAYQAQAGQLSGKVWSPARVQDRQVFPVPRFFDDAPGVAPIESLTRPREVCGRSLGDGALGTIAAHSGRRPRRHPAPASTLHR